MGRVGLKFAVLSVQIGFATTLLAATAGSGRSGARAHATATACKRLSSMTKASSLPLLKAQRTFASNRYVRFFSRWVGRGSTNPSDRERTNVRATAAFPPSDIFIA